MDCDDATDAELIGLWRRCGEAPRERDWEALFARLDSRLRRLVRSQLWRLGDAAPSREDVEELTQEVYCRLLRNERRALQGCRARTAGELWRYLERVCASVVVDRHRSRTALKRRDEVVRAANPRAGVEVATTLEDPTWCPHERLWRSLAREHILEACRSIASCPRLATRNLFIVQSVVFEGRSIGEVAGRVGMRKSGVSSVLARLRRRIGGALESLPGPSRQPGAPPPAGVAAARRVA